jgi:hypothetical protein
MLFVWGTKFERMKTDETEPVLEFSHFERWIENGRYGAAGASMARAPKKKKRGEKRKKRKERRGNQAANTE